MQIVSFLNVSNPDALEADSGFVFQKLLLEELATRGHNVLLIAPPAAAALTSVAVLPIPPPTTKYHARFGMDWRTVDEIMREHWAYMDVLLVNQPELASGLKAMSYIAARRRIPVVSYLHYLPLMSGPDETPMIDPSLDDCALGRWSLGLLRTAVECSDACIVGSGFARRLVSAQVGQARIEVIPPPCEPKLGELVGRRPSGDTLRLLYNQRLYDHYGTRQLFSELDRLVEEGVRFEVIVTAPTQWRSPARCHLAPDADLLLHALRQKPYVRIANAADRASYHDVLSSTHAGLAPWRRAPLWSMAVVDILAVRGRIRLALLLGGRLLMAAYLGLSGWPGWGHDPAACLIVDGALVAAVEEERLVRKRHAFGLTPVNAIAYCLERGGIRLDDSRRAGSVGTASRDTQRAD